MVNFDEGMMYFIIYMSQKCFFTLVLFPLAPAYPLARLLFTWRLPFHFRYVLRNPLPCLADLIPFVLMKIETVTDLYGHHSFGF